MKNHNEARLRAKFDQLSAGHQLIVTTDSGDYRRLRVQTPGTAGLGWDVLTWNSFVGVVGDFFPGFALFPMDLLTSFTPTSQISSDQLWIDPAGWAQGINAVLTDARERYTDENRARLWLMEHSTLSQPPISHWDLGRRDTTEFTDDYIYACLAIAATAKAYTEHKKET